MPVNKLQATPNRPGLAWKALRSRRYFRWREAQQQKLRYQSREILRLNDKLQEQEILGRAATDAAETRICSLTVQLLFAQAALTQAGQPAGEVVA